MSQVSDKSARSNSVVVTGWQHHENGGAWKLRKSYDAEIFEVDVVETGGTVESAEGEYVEYRVDVYRDKKSEVYRDRGRTEYIPRVSRVDVEYPGDAA